MFAALSVSINLFVYIDDLFYPLGVKVCLYLPFLCLVVYLLYRLFKYCCCYCATLSKNTQKNSLYDNDNNDPSEPTEQQPLLVPPTTTEVGLSDYAIDDEYPDRVLNAAGYK